MSRRASWGVALGATFLITLTGCAQQPSTATSSQAGGSADVCGLLAAPVTAALAQQGITATPLGGDPAAGCRWQDPGSSTTVTLKPGGSSGSAETTTIPGVGQVGLAGPGEVTFTAQGKQYDLTVTSQGSEDTNRQTAIRLVALITGLLGGQGSAPVSAASAPTTTQPAPATAGASTTPAATRTVGLTGALSGDIRTTTVECVVLGNGTYSWQLNGTLEGAPITVTFATNAYHGAAAYHATGITDEKGGLVTLETGTLKAVSTGDDTGTFTVDPGEKTGSLDADLHNADTQDPTKTVHVTGDWTCT